MDPTAGDRMEGGALPTFEQLFGHPPTARGEAPGRVNLIGEHTDYNDGFVLPLAVPLRTHVELSPRDDHTVRVWTAEVGESGTLGQYTVGDERPARDWLDYVRGTTAMLTRAGFDVRGFDARIVSTVPLGAGLSSSAALEIALLRALRAAFALSFDDVEMARMGRRVENEFLGAPVGIMDQMAACFADQRTALFLDTRTLAFERVRVPGHAGLAVIDSGVKHEHAQGEYRIRRRECAEAAAQLGVVALRDIGPDDMPRVEALPEPLRRRARHVVAENARVVRAVDAMRAGDLVALGALFDASQTSMQRDFEVSAPEVDRIVEAARARPGVFGVRMTGGGFGGCIIVLTARGRAHDAARETVSLLAAASTAPRVLLPIIG